MANNDVFAIKSAVYGTLHNVADADNTKDIDITYINKWDLGASEDQLIAKAQGVDCISMSANKKMTFTIDAEVLDENGLMLLVGGTKGEDGTITVGATPSTVYKFEGTFSLIKKDGTTVVKKATIERCKPQISDTVSLNASELSTFSLTFDILVDDKGNFLTIANNA